MARSEPGATLRVVRIAAWSLGGVIVACLTSLAALFLLCSNLPVPWLRTLLAITFVTLVLGAFVGLRPRWKGLLVFGVLFGLVLAWFALIRPSNDREWQPGVARLTTAGIDGDALTVRNVRNFRYRGVTDFDERWETREYDLNELDRVELLMSYWGSTEIAHTMLSFGFADGTHLALSVGPRPEVGEGYAPVHSFFKAFELVYTFADERDVVALRTNFRREDVYLFPLALQPHERRRLLLDVLERANGLAERPEFYRTIADNCTTALVRHLDHARDRPVRFSFKLLLNGYIPALAYERGDLPTDAPLDVVMRRYAITARALEAGVGPDYSKRIRAGLAGGADAAGDVGSGAG